MRRASLSLVLCAVIALAAIAGQASARLNAQLTVYAAASLTDVFPKIDSAQKY